MKRFVLITFLFACFVLPYVVFAQRHVAMADTHIVDSLQIILKSQNDDSNKVNTLDRLSGKYEIRGKYDSALFYAESAEDLAKKIKFQKGLAATFRDIGIIYIRQSNYQSALEYQFKAFTIYQDIGNKKGIAATLEDIGLIYYTLGNYSKALECDFKVVTIAQKIEDKNTIASVSCNIGIIYEEQRNYSKALEYLFESLKTQIEIRDKDKIAIDFDNIGENYLLQGDYRKALEYNFKAITQAQEVGDKALIANILGNIGNIYYKQDDYTWALEYDFKALAIAGEIGDIDEVANLYSNVGAVYTKLKNYKRAKTFLDSALTLSIKTGDKKYIKVAYDDLAKLDSLTGNYKTAYSDYEKYIAYRDSIIDYGTMQIELSYEFEKREDSIKAEYKYESIIKTAETKRKKIINDGIIMLLALTVLLAFSVINRQQVKRKKDKIISEKEKAMLTIEKQRMAEELLSAKKALEDHTKSMMEKNVLLEQFKTDMEKLKNLKSKELEEVRIEQLEHLNKTTILTEEDWDKFKELFEQVYKGFFIRLKEKLPDLTKAEIRLICLTKLKLDTKEMARILGVSSKTIRQTCYLLRKKLDLPEKDSLKGIADSI